MVILSQVNERRSEWSDIEGASKASRGLAEGERASESFTMQTITCSRKQVKGKSQHLPSPAIFRETTNTRRQQQLKTAGLNKAFALSQLSQAMVSS